MRNRQFFATFAVGALFGASILLAIRGHDLDLLYLRLKQKEVDLQQIAEDKQKLTEELSQTQKQNIRRLRKITVEVREAPDEFIKLAVQKEVKNRLRTLLNKKLTMFEEKPDLIHELLDTREFTFDNQSITVYVLAVVVNETTYIVIKAVKEERTLKPKTDTKSN